MRVVTPADIAGTRRDRMVGDGSVHAMCYLARDDGCGFSFSTVSVDGDVRGFPLHYRHHVEVNLVLKGSGELRNLESDESWDVGPGVLYCVGPSDRHCLDMEGPVEMVSLFNPPILGTERHQAFGGYPPSGPVPEGWEPGGRRMFVRRRNDLPVVVLGGGKAMARRYLTKADGAGLTVSDLTAEGRGEGSDLWYRHHVEANYVVRGHGEVMDRQTGERWPIGPGSLYVVGPKDRHRITNDGSIHILSIFNPPLEGGETHDADGSYPPTGEIPPAWRT